MRYGIVPPIVHRNPRFEPPAWEFEAGIEEIAAIAGAAERLGYGFVCFPGHVAIPREHERVRGAVYWDQVATMSFVAARTERIGLCAYVVVLGYRHPLEVCKTFGTIDRMSGGRLILGAGVGSLEPEFAALGRPFADRGARADDALRAIRASWGVREPVYHGTFYSYDDLVVDPAALRREVPLWIGGRTPRSLRRAIELGDGWAPFRLAPEEIASMLDAQPGWKREGFELILPPEPLDPADEPDATARVVERYAALGASGLVLRFRHTSLAHYFEQLEAMRAFMR